MEMVKIKYDNGVMSIRLPKWYAKEKNLTRHDYMVWKKNAGGNLSIRPLKEQLKDGAKLQSDPDEPNSGQSVSDEINKG